MAKYKKSSPVKIMRSYCITGSYLLMGVGLFLNLTIPFFDRPFADAFFDSGAWSGFISSFLICALINVFIWGGVWFRWYIDKISRPKEKSVWLQVLKFYLAYVVLIIVLLILSLVFNNHEDVNSKDTLAEFVLTQPLDPQELSDIIEKMRDLEEFSYYFKVLPQSMLQQVHSEIFPLLKGHWSKARLYEQIFKLKEEIAPLISVYANMEDESYLESPEAYPEMNKALWEIFYKEFKLAILGIVYKANFDEDFNLGWDEEAQRFAQNFRKIVGRLKTAPDSK